VVVVVQPIQQRVLVELQFALARRRPLREPLAKLLEQSLQAMHDLPTVVAEAVRIGDLHAPDRFPLDEVFSQGLALELGEFRKEGVGVAHPGDRLQKDAFPMRVERHT
jgi:hypothetical protein